MFLLKYKIRSPSLMKDTKPIVLLLQQNVQQWIIHNKNKQDQFRFHVDFQKTHSVQAWL